MQVLHIGKYYPPFRGGVETVLAGLCEGLAERGASVTALVSNDRPLTSEEMVRGVRVVRLARRWTVRSQPICPELGTFLRSWQGDLVHLHLPNPLAAWTCLRTRPQGKWLGLHHSDIVRQRLLALPADWVLRRFYAKAAAIMVPTPQHITHSRILPEFEDKCRVIHFGVDPSLFHTQGRPWDPDLPEDWQERPLVLFAGRLVYYKGVEVLLEAARQIPDVVVAVVGTGPDLESLKDKASALGLLHCRVRFLGEISEERLRNLYQRAAMFVLPSVLRSEAFGLVQLEAMASATPVISTDLPSGVPYVNQHEKTGLVVPPGHAQALAEAITRLATDPQTASRFGLAGRERVLREFTCQQMADQVMALYEELCAGAAGQPAGEHA